MTGPRVVVFGMRCAGTVPPLAALLAAGCDVRALVLPGPPGGPPVRRLAVHRTDPVVPLATEQGGVLPPLSRLGEEGSGGEGRPSRLASRISHLTSPVPLARAANLPVLSVSSLRHPDVLAALAALRPEAIAVACFPWRLPAPVLALPPLGCLNVHPSLLPAGRGPEPVFWALRRGERTTGSTVHLMDAGFDTGPILAQASLAVPPGVRAPELERRLMGLGGELLVGAIGDLAAGRSVPRPQDGARATAAPVPSAEDWAVPTDRPAAWAWGFVRGVAPLGGPLELRVLATGAVYRLQDALGHDPAGTLPAPLLREGGEATARFHPGTVRFLLAGSGD